LVEVLVVIAILGMLAALLLPAVQASREAARRMVCSNNLRQIGIGVANYESAFRILPPGNIRAYGQHAYLLPFIGEQPLFDAIEWQSIALKDKTVLTAPAPAVYLCPSDGQSAYVEGPMPATNYAANAGTGVVTSGYNGLYRAIPRRPTEGKGPIRFSDVTDGLSNTASFSEILVGSGSQHPLRVNWRLAVEDERDRPDEFPQVMTDCLERNYALPSSGKPRGGEWSRGRPWMTGGMGSTWYTHIFTPNLPSCSNGNAIPTGIYTAASNHGATVNVLFADGGVRAIEDACAQDVWRDFGSRSH
jgi:prepilin-type processing-associated H-X9-DG protein